MPTTTDSLQSPVTKNLPAVEPNWDYIASIRADAMRRAKLAEAAPALIAALKDLIGTIELHHDCMTGQVDFDVLVPWIDAAEAAIDKAEGQP